MVATIVVNQSNILPDGNNNTFIYKFPSSVGFPHHEIAIQSINMYYSWTNINGDTLNNNKYSYSLPEIAAGKFQGTAGAAGALSLTSCVSVPAGGLFPPIGTTLDPSVDCAAGTKVVNVEGQTIFFNKPLLNTAGGTITLEYSAQTITIEVVMPAGLYEISTINDYLQFVMISNKHYLISTAGNVYYADMVVNPNLYAVQVNNFVVPTKAQATTASLADPNGASFPCFPYLNTTTPASTITRFTFPTAFNQIVGFPAGFTTPTGTAATTSISTTAPQVQPNSSVYLAISNIANKYAIPSSIIYSLAPSVEFGKQINEYPPQFAWNRLLGGTYNELRIQFLGIDKQPLKILDPNITIVLVIRDLKETSLQDLVSHIQGSK